jgi:hypothetical protein
MKKTSFSYSFLFLFLWLACSMLTAQDIPRTYHLSYFGNNLWNPGLEAGVILPRQRATKSLLDKRDRKIHKNHIIDLGFYLDPGSHLGLFAHAGWQRKSIFPSRYFISYAASPIGLYRSFLPATYAVNDVGAVEKVRLPGRSYFAPSLQASLGRVSKKDPEKGIYLQAEIITLMPYNTYILPLLNISIGYHFPLGSKNK